MAVPPFGAGQRIGLFGGSFNPAHEGHRAVALCALSRLGLDWVWWLVSPQNPLKPAGDYDDFDDRLAGAKRLAAHPRFIVTDLERKLHTRTTAETLLALRPVLARGRFVWIMGADSFAHLHKWNDWIDIPAALPLAVFARPGFSLRALEGPASLRLKRARIPAEDARLLADMAPPAWVFLPMPLRKESSTAIRAGRGRHRPVIR
ncbi:nicotinate-nucleotide adenylyltransferase [soil metagenome]